MLQALLALNSTLSYVELLDLELEFENVRFKQFCEISGAIVEVGHNQPGVVALHAAIKS